MLASAITPLGGCPGPAQRAPGIPGGPSDTVRLPHDPRRESGLDEARRAPKRRWRRPREGLHLRCQAPANSAPLGRLRAGPVERPEASPA